MKVYLTSGKKQNWNRGILLKYLKNKIKEGHIDDIADFILYQYSKEIDYRHQLERLQDIFQTFYADKAVMNAFTEFDKGHQKASKDISKDAITLIKKALKGEL